MYYMGDMLGTRLSLVADITNVYQLRVQKKKSSSKCKLRRRCVIPEVSSMSAGKQQQQKQKTYVFHREKQAKTLTKCVNVLVFFLVFSK